MWKLLVSSLLLNFYSIFTQIFTPIFTQFLLKFLFQFLLLKFLLQFLLKFYLSFTYRAFSATEAVESAYIVAGKATDSTIDLAPQQVVDCDTTSDGCDGGETSSAYAYCMLKEERGEEGGRGT